MNTSDISGTKQALLHYLTNNLSNYSSSGTNSDNDIASLLQQSMTASNSVVAGLQHKAENASAYNSTLTNSGSLLKYLNNLSDDSSTSLFQTAESTGNNSKVVSTVENFVTGYNSLLQSLAKEKKDGTESSNLLSTDISKYSDQLKNIGITIGSDGKLNVDESTLKSASTSDLKALFGNGTDFSDSMSAITSKIQEDTESTCTLLAIYNSSYSNTGSYNQYEYMKNIFDKMS